MKRIMVVLCCIVPMFLSGCSSNRSTYNKAVDAYESKDYQNAIELFEELGDYEDSASYLIKATQGIAGQKISDLGDSIEDENELSDLMGICESLTQEQFAQISNASTFEGLFAAYIDELGSHTKWDEAIELIQDATMLSDDCIQECLKIYGRWASIESAEDYIKEQLKSPKSYSRYKASVSNAREDESEEFYSVDVYLDYGATNSFGAEVRDKEKILVHFSIDLDSKSVQFDCIGNELDILADALERAGF